MSTTEALGSPPRKECHNLTDSENRDDDIPEGSPDPNDQVSEPTLLPESQGEVGDADASTSPDGQDSAQGEGGPAAGWYPDPNAGGSSNMRYWDGSSWTHKVKEGLAEINTTRRSSDERKAMLAQQLQGAVARGMRIESQSDYQAVLVEGKPVNHVLHAIITIFSCGLWGIAWIVMAITGGEKREMIVVDEFGNVQLQKLGKS
jgi:hypothetical protein